MRFADHTQITPEQIASLFADQIHEQRHLDYKGTVDASDDGIRELLEDIISFANTDGGSLLIGIAEKVEGTVKMGYPGKFVEHGLTLEQFKGRVVSSVIDNIKPALPDLDIYEVTALGGESVIVVRVGRSRLTPHVIERKKRISCYRRNTYGKQPMDAYELREAYVRSTSVAEQIEKFVTTRREGIGRRDGLLTSVKGNVLVALHIIPETALFSMESVPLEKLQRQPIQGLSGLAGVAIPNHLGVWARQKSNNEDISDFYVQYYSNGIVENVGDLRLGHDSRIQVDGRYWFKARSASFRGAIQSGEHFSLSSANWTTMDPLWPMLLSYAFSGQNPTTLVDPDGLRPCSAPGKCTPTLRRKIKHSQCKVTEAGWPYGFGWLVDAFVWFEDTCTLKCEGENCERCQYEQIANLRTRIGGQLIDDVKDKLEKPASGACPGVIKQNDAPGFHGRRTFPWDDPKKSGPMWIWALPAHYRAHLRGICRCDGGTDEEVTIVEIDVYLKKGKAICKIRF